MNFSFQVLSGDSVIIRAQPRNGPPPEKQVALSSINAPRLGRKTAQEEVRDEAWAWESREFLRKLLVGKDVFFSSEKASNSNREYAKIFLDKGKFTSRLLPLTSFLIAQVMSGEGKQQRRKTFVRVAHYSTFLFVASSFHFILQHYQHFHSFTSLHCTLLHYSHTKQVHVGI